VDKSEQNENVVSANVSAEKDIVTNKNHDVGKFIERNGILVDVVASQVLRM